MTSLAYRQALEYRDNPEYQQEIQRLLGRTPEMNDRIRELAQKVDRIRDLYNIGPVHRDAVEQFAELIVQELVEKVAHDKRINWLDAAQIAKELKEHFGAA